MESQAIISHVIRKPEIRDAMAKFNVSVPLPAVEASTVPHRLKENNVRPRPHYGFSPRAVAAITAKPLEKHTVRYGKNQSRKKPQVRPLVLALLKHSYWERLILTVFNWKNII